MNTIAKLVFVAVALWAASSYAAPAPWTLLRTYTSAPADPNPNATPPAAANVYTMPADCSPHASHYRACNGVELFYKVPDAISTNTCNVTLWVANLEADRAGSDGLGDVWAFTTPATGKARYVHLSEGLLANSKIFVAIDTCSETIDGTNRLHLYVRGVAR